MLGGMSTVFCFGQTLCVCVYAFEVNSCMLYNTPWHVITLASHIRRFFVLMCVNASEDSDVHMEVRFKSHSIEACFLLFFWISVVPTSVFWYRFCFILKLVMTSYVSDMLQSHYEPCCSVLTSVHWSHLSIVMAHIQRLRLTSRSTHYYYILWWYSELPQQWVGSSEWFQTQPLVKLLMNISVLRNIRWWHDVI